VDQNIASWNPLMSWLHQIAASNKEALKTKINSYGKTWHAWMTGVHGHQADALPFGPPHLQWSFNRDGEANSEMVQARDSRMDLNSTEARPNCRGTRDSS
jgi:hypothetical protein